MTTSPEMRAPRKSSCGEAVMGGTEPVCRAHRSWNDAGSSRSIGNAEATWRRCHCALWLGCRAPRSLPARFRPQSFTDGGLKRLYRLDSIFVQLSVETQRD